MFKTKGIQKPWNKNYIIQSKKQTYIYIYIFLFVYLDSDMFDIYITSLLPNTRQLK